MNFDKLKKVPAITNRAPDIRKGDKPWSDVFEHAAKQFDRRTASSGLCLAVSTALGVGHSYDHKGERQADRMVRYVSDLLGRRSWVSEWIYRHNGSVLLDWDAYRAAWARHLAAQFRAKGL